MKNNNWQTDLEAYICQGEPDKIEKTNAWKAAIGLQDVDGLKTSDYLLDTAKAHIEGKISISDADKRIQNYYEERSNRNKIETNTKEADIVSVRIAKILGEKTFQFSPAELKNIHKKLFAGVFDHAGLFRTYNITKKEWVLKGNTVVYASFDSIKDTLDYDFEQEKKYSYKDLTIEEVVKHIAVFTSGIWQIHPFCEGNTRSTAVFIIKYLKTFGFHISNDTFSNNSWYFRNALVRANYNNWENNIHETTIYLEYFFENLLMNKHHKLKNRYLHVDYKNVNQSAIDIDSKCKNCTFEEIAILNEIKNNPSITQKELALKIGKSERTIKTRTVELQKKGYLKRENGKKNGKWKVT
ncbi:MAG: Fic family protein [Clostridium sp.]|nr:Fic family protein [Clostridium sp.]